MVTKCTVVNWGLPVYVFNQRLAKGFSEKSIEDYLSKAYKSMKVASTKCYQMPITK